MAPSLKTRNDKTLTSEIVPLSATDTDETPTSPVLENSASEAVTQIRDMLSTAEVAVILGISPHQVRVLIKKQKLLAETNSKNCYEIAVVEAESINSSGQVHLKNISAHGDTGLLEVSVGLLGVATAIMALLPDSLPFSMLTKAGFYTISLVVAFLSLYVSLWFLGEYVEAKGLVEVKKWECSPIGRGHIIALLTSKTAGPYRLLSLILILLVLGITFVSLLAL